jgi:hypothetical protein
VGSLSRMLGALRHRLTYANVMSTLAVFIALGGSAYAVGKINGAQLKNRSVSGKKLKRNTIGGSTVKESRLGRVPLASRAGNALRLQGLDAGKLLLKCPAGTQYQSDVCIELKPRSPAVGYGIARVECEGDSRRLPSYQELAGLVNDVSVQFQEGLGELVSEVVQNPSDPTRVLALVVTDRTGAVSTVPGTSAGSRPYRCATDPGQF